VIMTRSKNQARVDRVLRNWNTWRFTGSHEKPAVVWEAYATCMGPLSDNPDLFRAALAEAYTGRNIQMGGDLDPSQWLELFCHAGYITDGPERPTEAMAVFRGCSPLAIRQLSWTSDLDIACVFALYAPGKRCVYSCRVEPEDVLARFNEGDESELVIDPTTPSLRSARLLTLRPEEVRTRASLVMDRRRDQLAQILERSRRRRSDSTR
jgi:hypothetical protein